MIRWIKKYFRLKSLKGFNKIKLNRNIMIIKKKYII
jgi:hypothetical protein